MDQAASTAPRADPNQRLLRATSIALSTLALAFLPPYSVHTRVVAPALCLIPLGLSTLFNALHLLSPRLRSKHTFCALADLAATAALFAFLVPAWVALSKATRDCRGNYCGYGPRPVMPGDMLMGAYGSVPVIFAFVAHAYFACASPAGIFAALIAPVKRFRFCSSCPHCCGSSSSRSGYRAVAGDEEGLVREARECEESGEYHDAGDKIEQGGEETDQLI